MGWTLLNLQLTRVTASPFPGSERTGFWIAGFAGGGNTSVSAKGIYQQSCCNLIHAVRQQCRVTAQGRWRVVWRVLKFAVFFSACMTVGAADRATDESAIRDLVGSRQQQAWNQHNARAYAALFAEDGDVVNVVAWWWKGRTEIESNLTRMFANIFRESTLTFRQVDVRFLTPDVAIAHARWTMTGARMPPGLPEPREGLQTLTVQKRNGEWLIAAFHNTNYVPPPPTAAGKK